MTKPIPRNPPKIWTRVAITWQPIPDQDPPGVPFTSEYVVQLQQRDATSWHLYSADPPLTVIHTINLQNQTAQTEAFADPPTDWHQPLESTTPAEQAVQAWRPYIVPTHPLHTQPASTTAEITHTQEPPGREIEPCVAAAPGVRGQLGPHVLQMNKGALSKHTKSLTCVRDTPGQIAINLRFTTAILFWQTLTPDEKASWQTAADALAKSTTGYGYYLSLWMTHRENTLIQLRLHTGLALPMPPYTR